MEHSSEDSCDSIPRIPLPSGYEPIFEGISQKILGGRGFDPQSGTISLGDAPSERERLLIILLCFLWETNDLIENLNIVIRDLCVLPTRYIRDEHQQIQRLRLLSRTYFYEIGRMRDILGRLLEGLCMMNILTRKDKKELLDAFHQSFKGVSKFRNLTIHDVFPAGVEDNWLVVHDSVFSHGYMLKPMREGVENYGTLLHRHARHRSEGFVKVGKEVFGTIQKIFLLSLNHCIAEGILPTPTELPSQDL